MIDGLSYMDDEAARAAADPYYGLRGPAYMRAVTDDVAARHRVLPVEMRGPCQDRKNSAARDEAMAVIYATGRFSLVQVGKFFGGRDHTTVRAAKNRHEARALARQGAA